MSDNEEESTPENFMQHLAEHGYSAMEQAIGVENTELMKQFNELRMEDGRAEVQKTLASVELVHAEVAKAKAEKAVMESHINMHNTKALAWMTFRALMSFTIFTVLMVALPCIVMLWKAAL